MKKAYKYAFTEETHPTSDVLNDIRETEIEITQMIREIKGYRIVGDRLSLMRAEARVSRISERRGFIDMLKLILASREKQA